MGIQNPVVKGIAYALAGAMTFSSKAVFIKLAYAYQVDSVSLLLLRMLFSLPFYLFIGLRAYLSKRVNGAFLSQKDWWYLAMLGFSGYYLASIFDFIGLQHVNASLERLLLFIYPTIVVILRALFLKKFFQIEQIIALILTYSGMLFVFSEKLTEQQSPLFWQGVAWILAAAFTYAAYLTGSEYIMPKMGAVIFTTIAMSIACICVFIHFSFIHSWTHLLSLPYQVWFYGIILAIFCTVIPSFWVSNAIALIGSANMAIVASVGPITTIILAALLLGERITFTQFSGTFFVLFGVVYISHKQNSERTSSQT